MARIMIVEDEPLVLSNLIDLLGLHGFDTESASDGQFALEKLLDFADTGKPLPDLIVSDLMMPRRDGYDLLSVIKQDKRLNQIPFVILSARSDSGDFSKAYDLGASDYVIKPFEMDQLLKVINKHLDASSVPSKTLK